MHLSSLAACPARQTRPLTLVYYFSFVFLLGSVLSAKAQAPTISSFFPTTICQGETITIKGSGFTGATAVKAGSLAASSFIVNDNNTITAVVASAASNGTVTVTTPDGTATSGILTVQPAPVPGLTHVAPADAPFTNCNGNASYLITVSNSSSVPTTGNMYKIDWGDGTANFMQTDWAINAQTTHQYTAQGYFVITLTITPANGCIKTATYKFYNGANPLASFTTTQSTTGLCVPAAVQFQIGNWFNNSAGTTYQVNYGDGTPVTTLAHPLNATNTIQMLSHTYNSTSCPNVDFTATLEAINGCFTTTYTLNQIIIRIKPTADFSVPVTPACVNSAVCFANQTKNGYSGNACSQTSIFQWDFGDGTSSTLQSPPCHQYTAPGNYTVSLSASNTTCGADAKSKQVTVLPNSPPPTVSATPLVYCKGQAAAQLTATGTGLLWYSFAAGGTGSPVAPTPSTVTAGAFTYYVSQTLPNNCESSRVPVSVTVNPLPGAPAVSSPVQLCQGQVAGPLAATGTNLLWYNSATGGGGNPVAPIPSTISTGTTTYYVSQTTAACEGPRAPIVVNVSGSPLAPTVISPVTYCQFQTAAPLSASGSNLLWYTSATGGIPTSVAPVPSTSIAGTTTYYVSQGSGCGESPRVAIVVNVNTPPSATISYPSATLCNVTASPATPNPPVGVIQTGSSGGTYSIAPATGLPIDAATGQLTPSGAAPGVYTIRYNLAGPAGCGLFTTTTTVTVNAAPVATIGYPDLCTSDAIAAVRLTGSPGGTYSSTPGLSIDGATGKVDPGTSTPGTYTVTYTIASSAPCPGYVATTSLTITQAPVASISYPSTILCNVIATPATPNPPVPVIQTGNSGGTYSIIPITGLPIDATTGQLTPSGAIAGTYIIQYRVAGAGACTNFMTTTTVTVNATPTAIISYPDLCTSDAVAAVRLTGSPGGVYSSTAGLSINATTGTVNPGTSTPGTYSVTYTIASSAPCPGYVATTSLTITQAPAATISYPSAILCNVIATPTTPNPPVAVIQTGDGGGTYSIIPATGLPIDVATGQLTPSGAIAGTYIIQYRVAGAGACTNFMTTTMVTVNATPIASIQYPAASYCRGTSSLQNIIVNGSPGGSFSADPGLTINGATGSINPSLSMPGTYTVTYTIASSAPCPGFVTTTQVQINDYPVLTFAAPVQSICSGGTAIFVPSSTIPNTLNQWFVTGSLPAGVSGTSSGTSIGTTPLSFSFTNTGVNPQTLTIRVEPASPAPNSCPGPSYDLTLTVNPITPAPTPATFNFCMGDPSRALTVQPLTGTLLQWYDANHVRLSAPPVIVTSTPARFTYYITQTNSTGCESPAIPILAIVNPTPKIVGSSYSNPTICGVPSGSIILKLLDLNDNPIPNTPMSVHYNKFAVPYTALLQTDASGNVTIPLTAGTYSSIYVDAGGCVSQTIPDVFILKDPSPPASPDAGYNPPLCSGTPLTLTALSAASQVSGPLRYVWAGPAFGPLADTIDNSVITFPSTSLSDAGTYVVYAMQNNCISLPTSFSVAIRQSPSKPTVVTQNPLCVGDNLQLEAFSTIPPPDQALEYVWKGPGTGFPVNSAIAGVRNVQIQDEGVYSVTVTSPATGCSVTTDTLIRIGGYPILRFAQDTLSLPTGFLLPLSPIVVNAADPNILPMAKYAWTPAGDLACNDTVCASPVATIKDNTCYSVTGTNSYGCSGSAVICVKVFCQSSQVFIPNAFAPRGNIAANRILMVRATGITSVKSFRVFNRWGKIVFERSNFPPNSPDFGWDGMAGGRMADSGVYVYTADVICENGISYTFKGNVTLF